MVQRLEAGERLRDVAEAIDLSTTTVRRWQRRYQAEGAAGLLAEWAYQRSYPTSIARASALPDFL